MKKHFVHSELRQQTIFIIFFKIDYFVCKIKDNIALKGSRKMKPSGEKKRTCYKFKVNYLFTSQTFQKGFDWDELIIFLHFLLQK